MKFVLPALACSFVASVGTAQDMSVTPLIPVTDQPVLDFRVDNCSGEVGFGLMVYGTLAGAHHLTDLCFVEGTGLVVAGEVVRGLTATSDGPNGRIFEDISVGTDQYSRNYLHFMPDQNAPGCIEDNIESFEYVVQNPTGYAGYTGPTAANFAFTIGYTIPSSTNTPSADTAEVLFGIRNVFFSDTYEHVASAAGDMIVEATFADNRGTLEIREGAGFQYGEADGKLSLLVDDDGIMSLSGSFVALTNRVAGQQPSDMASLVGDILHFRGHLLGENGGQMLGYGIVSGTMTNVAGLKRPFRASTYLISCLNSE